MYSRAPGYALEVSAAPLLRQNAIGIDTRPIRATLMGLPSGEAAVKKTLAVMARLAREAIRSPSQATRDHATSIYKMYAVPPRAYRLEAESLQKWIQNGIRYVRDPDGVELVQSPEVTLRKATGDCDDQATLLAALLVATGHPSRLVAIAQNGGPLSHVLVETKIGDAWVPAETIIKKPLGWYPAGVTSRLVRDV